MNVQVAVITGAASGLGLELTKSCLERNMSVVMADNDVNTLSQQVYEFSKAKSPVLGVLCDVSDPVSVQRLLNETKDCFGRVDSLFNNAGIAGDIAPFWEQNIQAIEKVWQVNVMGVLQVTKTFLPLMMKQSWRSRIINIASVYGLCTSSCMSAYSMSKHALLAFSESLYFDLKRLNKPVDVSVVCPSFMKTALLDGSKKENPLQELLCDLIKKSRPVKDIVASIMHEIDQNLFYILPDQEVKLYTEQRVKSIVEQQFPHRHNLEKLITSLSKRVVT